MMIKSRVHFADPHIMRARTNASHPMVALRNTVLLAAVIIAVGCRDRAVLVSDQKTIVVSETIGAGNEARQGDLATIRYVAKLPDGEVVLNDDEYRFVLGQGSVIEAVEDGVTGMRRGGRRIIDAPPHKHWGRAGYGGKIPARTRLRIEIELIDLE